jgi:hypothetical protein
MESLPMGTFQTLQHLGDFCKLKIGKLTCGGKWSMIHLLVGGAITILKNMSSSMGRMTTHILWKIKNV